MKKINYKKEAKKFYNKIAVDYHNLRTEKNPKGWFYNELLEMPTTLKLLGNVKDKKILDIGCGTGIYAKILKKKGAVVKGIDISKEMIKIAKIGNLDIEFKVGNAEKLPYKNKEFDIVLSALTLEYISNWNKIFREVKRVLKNKGIFVFSTGNPVINASKKILYKGKNFRIIENYFREGLRKSIWKGIGNLGNICVKWHHRTYGSIIKTIVRNGFEFIDYEDAYPIKKAKKLFPEDYKLWSSMPFFCTWKIKKK